MIFTAADASLEDALIKELKGEDEVTDKALAEAMQKVMADSVENTDLSDDEMAKVLEIYGENEQAIKEKMKS